MLTTSSNLIVGQYQSRYGDLKNDNPSAPISLKIITSIELPYTNHSYEIRDPKLNNSFERKAFSLSKDYDSEQFSITGSKNIENIPGGSNIQRIYYECNKVEEDFVLSTKKSYGEIKSKPLSLVIIPTEKTTTPIIYSLITFSTPIKSLNLVVIDSQHIPSDHICYILKSSVSNKIYIGYTVNFQRRIRQHNGELVGGAKKTRKYRPWYPICLIRGFYDASSALRFEYRLQHPIMRRNFHEDNIIFILRTLANIVDNGDGSIKKGNKIQWPHLSIKWFETKYSIQHARISNNY
jgi:predicted GIY-YIG superfamily endonuclease